MWFVDILLSVNNLQPTEDLKQTGGKKVHMETD